MVDQIKAHLAAIAAEHASQEEAERPEQEARDYSHKWETRLHLFRTSEAAQFFREQNPESFDELWKRLQNLVYGIQRLALQFRAGVFLGDESGKDKVPSKLKEKNPYFSTHSIRELDYALENFIKLFQVGDNWYQAELANAVYYSERNVRKLGKSPEDFIDGFLTTQEWRQLVEDKNDRDREKGLRVDDRRMTIEDLVKIYSELLKTLEEAQKTFNDLRTEFPLPEAQSDIDSV